jgi:glycerol-3-phosphate cytidylyltransferase
VAEIVSRNELERTIENVRAQGKVVVTTNGCFDILHVGHTRFLQEAKRLGDCLVVGVNTDASVKRLGKGDDRPINNEQDRAEIICALACVDFVTIFDEGTPVEFLQLVRPNFHAKGSDYKPSDLAETPIVESFGGAIKIIELVPNKSTTNLVAKIRNKS